MRAGAGDGAAAAGGAFADGDARRMGAAAAMRRGAARAHPPVAAVVALALLLQALLEATARLGEVERLEELALLVGELAARRVVLEPVEELLGDLQRLDLDAVEVAGEGGVEGVEVLLAMHTQCARHLVEPIERGLM